MNTFIITSFILNFVHKCVISVQIREVIMATIYKIPNRKNTYRVQYKNPQTGKFEQKYFKSKQDAIIALGHWQQVELYVKNQMNWESLLFNQEPKKTINEIFTLFTNNVLSTMTNVDTIDKYKVVMNNVKKVFDGSMIAMDIRTNTQLIDGVEYTGWTIYKHIMEKKYNRSRRGIDSYMRDLLHIFNWAYEEEYITKRVMRKSDRYKKHELKPLEYKVWSNEEIKYLFHHPHLSAEQKDIAYLFAITGARANELVGHNMRKPYKELHWEHIDFLNNTMLLLQKRRKTRETVAVHPSAISILKRIFRTGADRPLDINYKDLNGIIKEISIIVGIDFTCHDLRRMKAQLVRKETKDVNKAGYSIGDKSAEVVDNHYAGVTLEEQRQNNNSAFDALDKIIKQ